MPKLIHKDTGKVVDIRLKPMVQVKEKKGDTPIFNKPWRVASGERLRKLYV